jgi:peptidoglycan glycosyltransferase
MSNLRTTKRPLSCNYRFTLSAIALVSLFTSVTGIADSTQAPLALKSAPLSISRDVLSSQNQNNLPLDSVPVSFDSDGVPLVEEIPSSSSIKEGKIVGKALGNPGTLLTFTLQPTLQEEAERLVRQVNASHSAIVAMDPSTGRVLAMAEKSNAVKNLALSASVPAASLFKVVTAAAAYEGSGVTPNARVSFRGGTYELEPWNYSPEPRRDRKSMSVSEALAKSCNPVFGRIALRFVGTKKLKAYTNSFGFGQDLLFDMPLKVSEASVPEDPYGLSRTGAGFGDVFLSPIHAATLLSAIAHGGEMMRPWIVDSVTDSLGGTTYKASPTKLGRTIKSDTAKAILQMMTETTTKGTSKKAFRRKNRPIFPFSVSAKTGTLRGTNPAGVNHWFISASPTSKPTLVLAILVVTDSLGGARSSDLGRQMIQKFESLK